MAMFEVRRYLISGIVQGVGFRPFVYRVAKKYDLRGWVLNNSRGVVVEIEGPQEESAKFIQELKFDAPSMAVVDEIKLISVEKATGLHKEFRILESRQDASRETLISPDASICSECLSELFDPADRRHRYPFINCTNCGPRYSIIKDIPYDRCNTTMHVFRMCEECMDEYEDMSDRRFHAEPNACWKCGPQLFLKRRDGEPVDTRDPILETVNFLRQGLIIAVKGLGGYHLMVDPSQEDAVNELRRRKRRSLKPFAMMSDEIDKVRCFAHVSEDERQLLASPQRPIVLLRKKKNDLICQAVAPDNRRYGVMLASTPLHYLLLRGHFPALVATSGNAVDEPIISDDDDALTKLEDVADFFLSHDRNIHIRIDDSIVRCMGSNGDGHHVEILRRARGYAPHPIMCHRTLPSVLALGADLKNTICLTKDRRMFVSQHIGNINNQYIYRFLREIIDHIRASYDIAPELVACDLHPDFLTSAYAEEMEHLPVVRVQHHHAHMASCMCEHGLDEDVIGVIFDGAGYGADGSIWGGEFLVGGYEQFQRFACLRPFPLPGGDKAVQHPYRTAIGILSQIYDEHVLRELPLPIIRERQGDELDLLLRMAKQGINSPQTSSMGRLFDAVSALIGVIESISHEGHAAMALEYIMADGEDEFTSFSYDFMESTSSGMIDMRPMIREIVDLLVRGGISLGVISRRFHQTIVDIVRDVCHRIRLTHGLAKVVLSGGVFMNEFLLSHCYRSLTHDGFSVYRHSRVPSNDGGVSLGQAIIAGLQFGRSSIGDEEIS